MDGDKLKQGLDGLSKIDSVTDFLYIAIVWIGILFVMVFAGYIIASLNCYLKRKKKGTGKDNDNFLDD